MIVRGRVPRQLAHDSAHVSIDGLEPSLPESAAAVVGEQGRVVAAQQVPCDAPIDQPNTELERAAPVGPAAWRALSDPGFDVDRKSTRLNSSHVRISYAVFCLKKKIQHN